MGDADDVGVRAVRRIHSTLMIDEPWTVWGDREFRWLGYRLAQTVSASPVFDSRGVVGAMVSACSIVVEDVQDDPEKVSHMLALMNFLAVGSAYVFLPGSREIIAVAGHFVDDIMLEDRSRDLASYAILQLAQAEQQADALAELAHGQVAVADHPTSGPRVNPDGMLAVVDEVFRPRGAAASLFADTAEMERVVAFVDGSLAVSLGSSAGGVCVEVAYGSDATTLIELRSDIAHPWLGAGLAVAMALPIGGSDDALAKEANALQGLAAMTAEGGGQLGAWAVSERNGMSRVVFCRFVPNALFRPNVVLDVAMGEINRALWVDQRANPDLPPRHAWPIIMARYAQQGGTSDPAHPH